MPPLKYLDMNKKQIENIWENIYMSEEGNHYSPIHLRALTTSFLE